MTKAAVDALEADIAKRLSDIAFHYEERDALCRSLSLFTQADATSPGPKKAECDRVVKKIDHEEGSILLGLVHIKDSVEKYFRADGLDHNELKVIDLFKPYRIAGNFVNVNKHGLRGRGAKTAVKDYSVLIFSAHGGRPGPTDLFAGYISIINYDGDLFQTLDLILDLFRMWELFLRNHTSISTEDFMRRISKVQSQEKGKSTYSMPMPEGMFRDAARLASERKSLDIK